MPFKWVEPDLYLKYFGVRIFHVYDDGWYTVPLNNWFTTSIIEEDEWEFDARELDELSEVNLAAGRKGGCDSDIAIKEAVMRAIELQTIDLPVGNDVDYPFKRGSFNWYLNHPGIFVQSLSGAVVAADPSNMVRFEKIYEHITVSRNTESWDKICEGEVINEPLDNKIKGSSIGKMYINHGSFYWYLHQSGAFVTHMANAIINADNNNRELIREVYPQMVAAYDLNNWNVAPDSFAKVYDAEEKDGGG